MGRSAQDAGRLRHAARRTLRLPDVGELRASEKTVAIPKATR